MARSYIRISEKITCLCLEIGPKICTFCRYVQSKEKFGQGDIR